MISSSSSVPSSLQRMILLINSISSFLIGMSYRSIQVGSQCPHYYIVPRFPGEQSIHMSVDKVNTDTAHTYPVKFLNSLNTSGLPLACLALKPGCPLMLLCNLDPANGLCNGTCMVLLEVRTIVLRCRILGGDHAGNIIFIPRTSCSPSEALPIQLSHHQFPVHLAFVMTTYK